MKAFLFSSVTKTAVLLAVVSLGIAGCDPANLAEQDYRIEHPLTAEKHMAVAVFDGPTLSAFDHDRLKAVAAESVRRGAGTVEIAVETDPGSEGQAKILSEQIAAALRFEGVQAVDPHLKIEAGLSLKAEVRAPIWVAVVPTCGTFERGVNPDHTNAPNSNWGCSIQRNTALMLQNPADLIRARQSSGRDANRSADVLGKYDRGEATSSAIELQSSGSTSSVGNSK